MRPSPQKRARSEPESPAFGVHSSSPVVGGVVAPPSKRSRADSTSHSKQEDTSLSGTVRRGVEKLRAYVAGKYAAAGASATPSANASTSASRFHHKSPKEVSAYLDSLQREIANLRNERKTAKKEHTRVIMAAKQSNRPKPPKPDRLATLDKRLDELERERADHRELVRDAGAADRSDRNGHANGESAGSGSAGRRDSNASAGSSYARRKPMGMDQVRPAPSPSLRGHPGGGYRRCSCEIAPPELIMHQPLPVLSHPSPLVRSLSALSDPYVPRARAEPLHSTPPVPRARPALPPDPLPPTPAARHLRPPRLAPEPTMLPSPRPRPPIRDTAQTDVRSPWAPPWNPSLDLDPPLNPPTRPTAPTTTARPPKQHRYQVQRRDQSDIEHLASQRAMAESAQALRQPYVLLAGHHENGVNDSFDLDGDVPEADEDDPEGVEAYREQIDSMLQGKELQWHSRSDPRRDGTSRRGRTAQDLVEASQLDRGGELRGWGPPFALPDLRGTTRYVPTSRAPNGMRNRDRSTLGLAREFERLLSIARKSGQEPTKVELEKFEAIQKRLREEEAEAERILQESKVKAIKKRQYPPKLSKENAKTVQDIFNNRGYQTSIKGASAAWRDMYRLSADDWLNDELINFYGVMINNRSNDADAREKAGEKNARGVGSERVLKAFCFNTNFFTMYSESGFAKVKRWTRRFDTFEKDIIIIPINHNNTHWCCAAVNIAEKRFEYYDSLGRPRDFVYKALREWLSEEHQSRKGTEIDLSEWENYWNKDVPQQGNINDCGVFTCMFMESLSRDSHGFDFIQKNMPYLRRRIALEIDNGKLMGLEPFR